VRQALTGVEGVVSAEVSFSDARAVVRYRPTTANVESMVSAVAAVGFRARPVAPPDTAQP